MGTKKRHRSESFQADQGSDDDARNRLAAFHARMFDWTTEDSPVVTAEVPRMFLKATNKKKVPGRVDADDGEAAVPMVKLHAVKGKKKKKKKIKTAVKDRGEEEGKMTRTVGKGITLVHTPGMSKTSGTKKIGAVAVMNNAQSTRKHTFVEQAPQWHSRQRDDGSDDEEGDLLEQALESMKEIGTRRVDKSLHKKHRTVVDEAETVAKVEKVKENMEAVVKKISVIQETVASDTSGNNKLPGKLTNRPKKKKKRLRKQAAEETPDNKLAPDDLVVDVNEEKLNLLDVSEKVDAKPIENEAATHSTAPSPKIAVKERKSATVTRTSSSSPKTQAPVQPRQKKPLVISENLVCDAAKCANKAAPNMVGEASGKKAVTGSKPAVSFSTKAVSNDEKSTAISLQPLTLAASSFTQAAKKQKDDMFLSTQEESIEKGAVSQVVDEVSSESEDGSGDDLCHSYGDNPSLFSRLIDSAAREQWELVEVGRLVRLFAAEWDFDDHQTARFLCKTCPELVNVDFLEGLGVSLSAKRLVQVFEAGSGNSRVLMNKMASAVENGHLSVRDRVLVSVLERRVALMETNAEVMELLHPLLESLSAVRDVGCLLKQLCEHWQLERKIALVQQVLLSNVFDDLDGNQDEILLDLPDLTGRLDFPSRLDQEDVDENGNLKGFLADDDSGTEEGSEEDVEAIDIEDDKGPYETETDSEEEVEISGRSRGRNQFIEDEVDVGDEDDDVEEEERSDNDASSSSDNE